MNLETRLSSGLRDAVRVSVESQNFSNAVLDAIHYVSGIIRDLSRLEGNGAPLIGQAFALATPTIKVNRLQTESEQNEQTARFKELSR